MERTLKGKVVVITGASSGFGKGAARRFAQSGCLLVLAARRAHLLEELAKECEVKGARAVAAPTDVSKRADVERLAEKAVSSFGRIDVWINDAGVGALGAFEQIPLADHAQVIETDLMGTLYGSYFAMQQFQRQKEGTLINIASVLGKIPAPYYSSYTAAKYGIVGLSAAIRQELRQKKLADIHVCTVMPTTTDTPFFDHVANYTGHEVNPVPPLYEPSRVVDVLVRLAMQPEDEVMVGGAAKLTDVAHHLAPETAERLWARQVHKTQMEEAAPASAQSGALHQPMDAGTEVSGGRLTKRRIEHDFPGRVG